MRKLILFSAATTMLLAAVVAWTTAGHSTIKPSAGTAQIDPFSMMLDGKDLPTQEELNLEMWSDNEGSTF
jgi:hypothetical protein